MQKYIDGQEKKGLSSTNPQICGRFLNCLSDVNKLGALRQGKE
jgi:hypothetical protein